ncbi:MAG: dihydroneopterin aldolase [Duncaniella sp.]|nr:dihydroneopterin aldolase [Duncaniella sp.]
MAVASSPRLRAAVIEVNGLRLFARHGVMEQERVVGNTFEVSVALRYPIDEAMRTDRVEATLNYAEAVDVIKEVMAVPSQLLEHVAGRLLDALTSRWPAIEGGCITVRKLTPPIPAQLRDVAVKIEW